ncbi:MAG TPA: CDP-alcohol phosphatidyltransferase family protein, partial [Candidatus Saccharimonadales bacterium]|nr:CDP-alcohol phosphatidyltransferase family protein [Candidatus Saccharimonadales bacterium]
MHKFKWLPNFFTAARLVLVPPIVLLAIGNEWVWAFWLVIVALITDFLDGLAAKQLNAYSTFGERLDPLADFALAAAGITIIILSGDLSWWVGLVMFAPAVYISYAKFLLPADNKIHIMQPMFSVPYLFVAWAITAWYFATRAYGWSWWYVAATVVVLVLAALPKRHRLRT